MNKNKNNVFPQMCLAAKKNYVQAKRLMQVEVNETERQMVKSQELNFVLDDRTLARI